MFDLARLRSHLGEQWEPIKAYNLDRIQAPGRLEGLASMMAQFAMPAIPPPVLTRITVPTALIWGRHDRATPLQVARDASARYQWSLHVIDEAADDPILEQPQAFVSVLRAVVAELTSPRTAP
jgi:pimeloyl-ACP methyl ester carboxylesterase